MTKLTQPGIPGTNLRTLSRSFYVFDFFIPMSSEFYVRWETQFSDSPQEEISYE